MVFHKKYKGFVPAGVAAATASLISFSFSTVVLRLDSFILKWCATTAADFNLQDISSNSTSLVTNMPFLCFSGALPASLVALRMGPMVSVKAYSIALNTENTRELREIIFNYNTRFTRETNYSCRNN